MGKDYMSSDYIVPCAAYMKDLVNWNDQEFTKIILDILMCLKKN